MIKTLIIDDEHNARELLQKMLSRYFPGKFLVCQLCESVDEAIQAIEQFQPELIFLDIQMPGKNGFDLLKELKSIDFEVIFTTAHSEYAIEAIKRSALDYLLKPINYIDLLEAVNRFEQKKNKQLEQNQLAVLLENMDGGETAHKKIAIATESGFEFLKFNSIIYLEAQSNYTKFHLLNNQNLVTSKTLKHFDELLPTELFFRTHKSFLVNLNFIKRFTKIDELVIELATGQKLPVSIRKKDEFISKISQSTTH
jgi:two-component system LytT family response regulator